MLLTLDVGNSQIFGGVYDGDDLKITFRRTSSIRASSDEFGTFFRATLRENGVDPEEIDMAAICSVVPDAVHSLRNCFRKYFRFEPFLLQPGVKTGLKIRYRNPLEVGADKIANAIGAAEPVSWPESADRRFWHRDHAVRRDQREGISRWYHHAGDKHIHGGAGIADRAAARGGDSPAPRGSGAFDGGKHPVGPILRHSGTVRSLAAAVTKEHFAKDQPLIVGTGGFGRLFEKERLFDEFVPELPLLGLRRAVELAQSEMKK